jgi:(2R)-ethylmalonyl-CoA mutase
MKQRLVESNARRLRRIEGNEQTVVGVNDFVGSEPSPLMSDMDGAVLKVDDAAERAQIERLDAFRASRNDDEVAGAIQGLRDAATAGDNVMPASIRCAHAGVTTGEWSDALREIFGEYRAPTGVGGQTSVDTGEIAELRSRVKGLSQKLGRTPRLLVGKPGLDGHSNGAEQIAVRARDIGLDVIYQGIRLTPDEILATASQEDVDAIGLSILSGSHMTLVPDIVEGLARADMADIPVVVGGIIPDEDAHTLRGLGVAGIYTPKDYELSAIMRELLGFIEARRS